MRSLPGVSVDLILPRAGEDQSLPAPPRDDVVAVTARDEVVTAVAVDGVLRATPQDAVRARGPVQRVVVELPRMMLVPAGQQIGLSPSATVTLNEQGGVPPSVAGGAVSRRVPSGNVLPDGGTQVTGPTEPQLSVAVAVNVAIAPERVRAHHVDADRAGEHGRRVVGDGDLAGADP